MALHKITCAKTFEFKYCIFRISLSLKIIDNLLIRTKFLANIHGFFHHDNLDFLNIT